MRYELADDAWIAIKPMLPNKTRGVPRFNDRRVLNGIFWVLRSGALGVEWTFSAIRQLLPFDPLRAFKDQSLRRWLHERNFDIPPCRRRAEKSEELPEPRHGKPHQRNRL